MNISELVKQAHDNAVNKGFYDCPECGKLGYTPDPHGHICFYCNGAGKDVEKNVGELLMLVVSELGEALEAHRKSRFSKHESFITFIKEDFEIGFKTCYKDTFEDELADVAIRLFDLCGYLNIDLEKHIELKMKYNATREYKHGKRY